MEISYRPGNLSCGEAREYLSDLLDARRGELPHPDGSRLSEPGLRPALELHLAACEQCRREIQELEQVGEAYAAFSVNEASAQMFADYGQKVRARMKQDAGAAEARPLPGRARKFWLAGMLSASAAAAWMLLASPGFTGIEPGTPSKNIALATNGTAEVASAGDADDANDATEQLAPLPQLKAPINYEIRSPDGRPHTYAISNPLEPAQLQEVQQREGQSGYLIFPEPLLGVRLRTTRDLDRVANQGPGGLIVDRVIAGSPAWQMGIRRNDYIVTINGNAIKEGGALQAVRFLSHVRELGPGKRVELHVVRPVQSEFLFLKPVSGVLGQYEFIQ